MTNEDNTSESVAEEATMEQQQKMRELVKSIAGHKTWLVKHEKKFYETHETITAESMDRLRMWYKKIEHQTNQIESKYEILVEVREECDLNVDAQWAEHGQISNVCAKAAKLLQECEQEFKGSPRSPAQRKEAPESEELVHEAEGSTDTNRPHRGHHGGGPGASSFGGGPGASSFGGGPGASSFGGGLGASSFRGGLGASSLRGGLGASSFGGGAGASSFRGGADASASLMNNTQSGLFNTSQGGTSSGEHTSERIQMECMKKLPSLTLRTFSGKPEEDYQRWRHHFEQMVDSQAALSHTGKYTFLLQSLKGHALRQIEDYTAGNFTDGAYRSACSMLEKLYGGVVREQARTQVRFRRTPPLQSMHSKELARVFIACSSMKDYLEQQGNQGCLTNPASADFRDARSKLGHYLRDFDLWMVKEKVNPCFNALVQWLREHHEASEYVSMLDGEDDFQDVSNLGRFDRHSSSRQGKPPEQRQSNQRTNQRTSGGASEFRCVACNSTERHRLEHCEKAKGMSTTDLTQVCRRKKVCFHCLQQGHFITSCYVNKERTCGIDGCTSHHHRLLHKRNQTPRGERAPQNKNQKPNYQRSGKASHKNDEQEDTEEEENSSKEVEESHNAEEQLDSMHSKGIRSGKVSIQVASVRVHYKNKSVIANILLDEGSNNTNINEDLADFLEMKRIEGPVDRTLNVMGGQRVKVTSNLVKFEISPVRPPKCLSRYGVHDHTRFPVEAWTMKDVCGRSALVDWNLKKNEFSHLRDIQIPTLTKKDKIDIVLGTNLPGLLAVLESRVGPSLKDPVAHLTKLGWFLMGPSEKNVGNYVEENSVAFRAQEVDPEEDLERLARAFWDSNEPQKLPWQPTRIHSVGAPIDALSARGGFSARNRKFPSEINQEAYDKMAISGNINGKFYTAAIPWKNGRPNLTSNRKEVLKRQQSTFAPNYLKRKGVVLSELTKVIEDYKQKGYIRLLEASEISYDSWYLPCFPVVDRSRATTKIRIVFDGQAEFHGTSLNKETLTGPNLLLNYLQILFRFRKFKVCFLGDISEMFLQIRLEDEDQKYHRFLFADENGEIKDYQWCRTVFGGTSIPNISQKVLHCLVEDFGTEYPEAVETIIRSLYMDDAVDSRRTIEEAIQTIKELSELLPKAGMTPRKWMSNSCAVLDQVPHSERAKEVELVGNDMLLRDGKILGVKYSPQNDDFFIVGNEIPGGKGCRRKIPRTSSGEVIWTKRTVLSLLFKQYDPLGFVTPYTIRGKMIVQRLMALGLSWDVPIPKNYLVLWESWLACLGDLSKVRIKRYIGMGLDDAEYSIHCFVDASQEAYGTVFYLRTELKETVQVAFLMSRARVTPMKAVSIARLELMAAQLGAETSLQVRSYLGEGIPIYFYTDSMDVMFWLSQPSKHFKAFVANRCGVVQSLTNIKNWRHVPSASNAADIASRGSKVAELATNTMWWSGPPFLSGPKDGFPKNFQLEEHTVDQKIKDEFRPFLSFKSLDDNPKVESFLDPQKFSVGDKWDGWKRLRRRTALLLGWPRLNNDERLQKAEVILFRQAQYHSYKDVVETLRDNQPLSKKHPLSQYTPFLDRDGLLRSKSRLEHTDIIPEGTRLPIILPSRSRITLLLVMSLHFTLGHAVGDNHLRSHLAKRFLIPSIYFVERQIKKQCFSCIKRNAQVAEQRMGPLPSYRFSEPIQAFSRTGVDFAGPFRIKQKRETRSNPERPKHYVLVFTCLSVRAVHFEVTPSIDTDAVLNAISRFSDRRGVPEVIVSDNGKSFESADRILGELFDKLDKEKLKEATSYGYKEGKGITWEFNPPYASHMGGVYEIIVKAMKRALHSTYGYADLYLDEFLTAITGAEGLLNSRPLGMVKMSPEESVVLTPNHFLNTPLGDLYQPSTMGDQNLGRKWRHLMEIQKHYKRRFLQEIIPQLHPRRKWKSTNVDLQEGDLVMEIADADPRSLWKIARIVKVLPGSDNLVRKVLIRILGSDTDLLRPIHRLLPLEFGSEC